MPKSIHSTTRLVTPHYLLNLIILNPDAISDLKASLSIASGGGTGSQPPVRTIIIVIIMMRIFIMMLMITR